MARFFVLVLAFAGFFGAQALPAHAQNTMTQQPAAATAPSAKAAMDAKKQSASPAKPSKNAQVMRECGAEWKAAKAAGTVTKGQTWRDFLKECRKKKKEEKKA